MKQKKIKSHLLKMQLDPSQKVFKQLLVGSRMKKYMFPITREAPISGTCEKSHF